MDTSWDKLAKSHTGRRGHGYERETLRKKLNNRLIDLVGRVFANGPGDLCSIPGRVIPKT